MSGSVNKAFLLGSLGKDPEIRTTPSGKKVANFSIATNESWTDKDGMKHEKTEWHRLVLWGGLADIAEKYLKKGSSAFFEGKIATRDYTPTDGIKRYNTEIIVSNLQLIGSKGDSAASSPTSAPQGQQGEQPGSGAPPPGQDDEFPF